MFKNRAIRMQLVKTGNEETRPLINVDDAVELATVLGYWGKKAAIGFTIVYAVKKSVDTANEVALLVAYNKLAK